jgi:acyl-CoA synthetase (AMP-forming)/AMP-acid ligase II
MPVQHPSRAAAMPLEWNFADVWETVASTVPGAAAQVHGDSRIDWRTFDRRADGVAAQLLSAGLARHDKVALYLYNTPEYLETAFAVMKAGLVPVNTNYRYKHDELHYLWDNADAAAVVFDGEFNDAADALRARCPKVKLWLHVGRGRFACPLWAASYEAAAAEGDRAGRTASPWGRSGDDPVFIYTGGTTGRPKGVMWRQHGVQYDQRSAGRGCRPCP